MENSIIKVSKVHSYYQDLCIKHENGDFSWGISDCLLPTVWQPIPQGLFFSILKYTKNNGYIKDVFIFENTVFSQIPNNPVNDFVHGSGGVQRKKACIIVCCAVLDEDMFEIVEIPLAGEVIKKGLFFDLKQAVEIAYLLSY